MDPYREKGIEWIYKLVEKDSECKATLYDHTLFYLEEYIGSFVARHRMEFRMDVKLAQKMQIILEYMVSQESLEYMVSQESQIAFLLGSKFDILFAVVTHPILTTVLLLLRKENQRPQILTLNMYPTRNFMENKTTLMERIPYYIIRRIGRR